MIQQIFYATASTTLQIAIKILSFIKYITQYFTSITVYFAIRRVLIELCSLHADHAWIYDGRLIPIDCSAAWRGADTPNSENCSGA